MKTHNTITQILKYFLISITIIALTGCSLMPFKEESACNFDGMGKCLPIDKAYKEAVSGIDQGGKQVNGKTLTKDSSPNQETTNPNTKTQLVNAQQKMTKDIPGLEQAQIYHQTQALITDTETPLLKPAVVRRVLILPYSNKNSLQWFESRSAFYIEEKPKWELDLITNTNSADTSSQLNLFN